MSAPKKTRKRKSAAKKEVRRRRVARLRRFLIAERFKEPPSRVDVEVIVSAQLQRPPDEPA